MERKISTHCNLKKILKNFTTNIQSVKIVIIIEV